MNTQELIQESQRWLDIISAPELTAEQKDEDRRPTRSTTFSFYYNRGYLEYRKSVIEMRDDPALEWGGEGSTFQDLSGRTYIDCLGGYGIYSAGIRHPKIVKAVADQLAAHAALEPGAARPAARRAGGAARRDHAGRPAVLLLHQQRHRRRRGRDQARPPLHRARRTSSARCAASTARAAARCRCSASGSTASRSCRSCPASTSSSSATRRRSRTSSTRPTRPARASPP